ncbi:hypothetical protein [Stieleria marina]|uniref:hypothetical protein n=1 Tax=Stieleria marina TaxID=1930275 RepID=UPI003AF38024
MSLPSNIRSDFYQDTWSAFWLTVVDEMAVDEVAQTLSRSKGSIYTARSRVMARLKEVVQELDVRDKA